MRGGLQDPIIEKRNNLFKIGKLKTNKTKINRQKLNKHNNQNKAN